MREQKASAAGTAIVGTSVGTPVWTPRRYDQFAKEGYFQNAIAFHCISMTAQAGAFIPLIVRDKKTKKEIDDPEHPLLKLINNPAPNMTGNELIERSLTFSRISGNSYYEKVGPSRKDAPPLELYSLRPDRMKIIAGAKALPLAYTYEANGVIVRWEVDQVTGMSDILHLMTMNPLNDWYGMSPMEPAAYAIDLHNEAGAHNMALLQNGAVPSGALVFKPVVVDGNQQNAPEEVLKLAEKRLEDRYAGAKNAGRPMTLGGNISWETFGLNMQQMQMTESKLDAARDICTTYGVPHVLVVPGQSTYNNNREAKLAFYEETVLPLMDNEIQHLNVWLTPAFGDNIELAMDLDAVSALSLRREENRKSQLELFKEKLVTRGEAREAMDYEPLEDMAPFDPEGHDVQAIVALITGGKLSAETGLAQLQTWGLLPKDMDPAAEADKVANESGGVDGLTGLDALSNPIAPPAPVGLPKPPATKPQLVKP